MAPPLTLPFSIDKGEVIELVREYPAIWDKTKPEYKIKSARNDAWQEICCKLNEDYEHNFTTSERVAFCTTVIRAWTTARECWVQSLKRIKNKSPYYHHNKMLFLYKLFDPTKVSESDKVSNTKKNNETQIKVESNDSDYEQVEYLYADSDGSEETEIKPDVSDSFVKTETSVMMREEKTDDLNVKRKRCRLNQGSDEEIKALDDRYWWFFKSIQPSLATLNEEQVLEFQSGVIDLLKSIKNRIEV